MEQSDAAIDPSPAIAEPTPAADAPMPAREQGTVSRWTDRGFGFITPNDGGEDLFCHFSNIEDGNGLEPGSTVEFVKIFDERKGKERAEQITGGITVSRMGGGAGGGKQHGVCFDWQKGQCTRGAACRFSHEGPNFGYGGGYGYGGGGFGGGGSNHRVCFDWQKGQCTRGYASMTTSNHASVDASALGISWLT